MPGNGPKLAACLGNPGLRYRMTRHNAGFWVADVLASEAGVSFTNAGLFEAVLLPGGPELLKPRTWMNESGTAVREFLGIRGLECGDLLVVCDDVNLPLGTLRLRGEGSHGGHNGLRDIIEKLGTEDFARLRLGVGPAPGHVDLADYVLEKVPDRLELEASLMAHRAADCVLECCREGLEVAQSVYNRKPPE
jgi:PTH1 family peptidyl-tRNA hydrolase